MNACARTRQPPEVDGGETIKKEGGATEEGAFRVNRRRRDGVRADQRNSVLPPGTGTFSDHQQAHLPPPSDGGAC